MITFNHSGKIGDILYSLYFCKEMSEFMKEKQFNFHIQTNFKEMNGIIGMDNKSTEFILPLLKYQKYINNVTFGDEIPFIEDVFNLVEVRNIPINIFGGDIRSWYYNLALIHLPREFWKPIIQVEPNYRFKDKILFTWTFRYQNILIDYNIIKQFKDKLVFIGLQNEYDTFKQKYFNIQYIKCKNMLEIAQYMAGAKGFIGNQGGNYSLAECMKIPRILVSPQWIVKYEDPEKKPIPGPANNHPFGGWNEFAATNNKLYSSLVALLEYNKEN